MIGDLNRSRDYARQAGLGRVLARCIAAHDMTEMHDAWSPQEAADVYEYGGFRLFGTILMDGHSWPVHLYRGENLNPVLSRDPAEFQLTIWLAETFVLAQAETLIEWMGIRHPEVRDVQWYDVDAGRWPTDPLPASRVDQRCPRMDFIRDPTFPLDTRVMAVVLNTPDVVGQHVSIVPKLRAGRSSQANELG